MNEKLLEDLGLTKGEITVYLTLLKLGETTTGKIIEEAGISSGKIYEILDKLIKKGLAGYITKEKTKYFTAASPKRILNYLNKKEHELKEKEKQLIKELPKLLALEKTAKKDYETTLFQGFKGYETAIFEALSETNQKDTILSVGVMSNKQGNINVLWRKWHQERIKRKIKCKIIFSDKEEHYKKLKKMKYANLRVISGITPAAVDVIGKRVLILTHGEKPSVLSIKNPEIVESFTNFFNNLWCISKF